LQKGPFNGLCFAISLCKRNYMKYVLFTSVFMVFSTVYVFSQIGSLKATALNMNSLKRATEQLRPVINEMGKHNIVGLGEGTHGTKQFNDIRVAIIKKLITEKGFNTICFENSFGDSYYLNKFINGEDNITTGMQKYLLAIWQTEEIKNLLLWLRNYNKATRNRVVFAGMDFALMANTAQIIKEELQNNDSGTLLKQYAASLYNYTCYYDSIWTRQNDSSFVFSFDTVFSRMKDAYTTAQIIDSLSAAKKLKTSEDFRQALLNIHHWYNSAIGEEASRDQFMAQMAIQFAKRKNSKVIVWAHEVHLALKSPYSDNRVGGTGGFIKQQMPGYYVIGMGTAEGTFSATTDRYDTRINVMLPYAMNSVRANTWDEMFANSSEPSFFIQFSRVKATLPELPLRVIGYGTNSNDYSDKIALNDLFNAYIFIRSTSASKHIVF
jgi:erythromycin esterase